MQTVDFNYVKEHPGVYQLKDSNQLFFIMKNGLVYYYIPEEQALGLEINHNFWANSKFLPIEE